MKYKSSITRFKDLMAIAKEKKRNTKIRIIRPPSRNFKVNTLHRKPIYKGITLTKNMGNSKIYRRDQMQTSRTFSC